MKKSQPVLAALVLLLAFFQTAAQTIKNPQISQLPDGKIQISYDLDHPRNDTKVKLKVSNQGYSLRAASLVSGDVGVHLRNGQKTLVWDWPQQFQKLQGAEVVLEVLPKYVANGGSIDFDFLNFGVATPDEIESFFYTDFGMNFTNSRILGWGVRGGVYPIFKSNFGSGIERSQGVIGSFFSVKFGAARANFQLKLGPIWEPAFEGLGGDISLGGRLRLGGGLSALARLGFYDFHGSPESALYLTAGLSYSWAKKQKIKLKIPDNTQPSTDQKETVKTDPPKPKPPTDDDPNTPVKNIVWLEPNPDELPTNYTVGKPNFPIKLKVVSPYKTIKSDYKIYVNDQIIEGDRAEQGSLAGETFAATVSLQSGKNKIQVWCRGKLSAPLHVNYDLSKPVLHLIAVGVSQPDLKFTEKDATDLAALYQANPNTDLFSRVQRKVLIGEKATAAEIRGLFEEYKTLFQEGEISANDVLMVSISSHGFVAGDKFYIQGSDYQALRRTTTSVAYHEIMEQLGSIRCKKIMFIDACHSGGARASQAEIFDALKKLSQQQNGLYAVASSAGNQVSYEDPAWQNGALTEALLEGMNGAADGSGTTGKRDGIIYLFELFDYLRQRVPRLVQEVKREVQTPTLIRDNLGDIPIFIKK